jgi:tRNA(Ile)-lysidine synthase
VTGAALAYRVADGAAWARLQVAVEGQLTRRLRSASSAPVAVAFSGGGDSLALLLLAKVWADAARRSLLALTVDHRLQPQSQAWAADCARRAGRLGIPHRTLVWACEKPVSALAVRAREARHGLLATAARESGAHVLLMGHTLDDSLEARLMREGGGSISEPRTWSPSPAWPQGRDLFLLRPMLALRRAEIRAGLVERGEAWLEDPANENLRSLRARARRDLAAGAVGAPAPPRPKARGLFACASVGFAGDIRIPAAALTTAPEPDARAFLGAALLCAAGSRRPPRREKLERLLRLIAAADPVTATLAGARTEAAGGLVRIMRDSGAMTAVDDIALMEGRPVVFDGRFLITTQRAGWRLGMMRGRLGGLSPHDRQRLKASPPAARRTVPALIAPGGAICLPQSPLAREIDVRGLGVSRLAGACGAIDDEEDVERVAKRCGTS